jgi:hypothetical integral membrane protein (TIGR02206 family)
MFFSDVVGIEFEPFSVVHYLLFLFIITGSILIFVFRERLRHSPYERRIAIGIATFAFLWEIALYTWKIANGLWTWDGGLPLGLCGMTLYIAIFAMYFKRYQLFEIGYYWTWGAIASVLFPDIPFSYDRFRFYQFMFGHMLFFFMFLYMIFVYQWYPTWRSFKKSVIALSIITAIFTLVSNITDTNLMFMKESEGTPLSMFEGGPYALYVLGVVGLALVVMFVWHIPWIIYDKKRANQ